MTTLEQAFEPFRKEIVGYRQAFVSPYGEQRIVYADWTASGRLFRPIERILLERFGPFVGNTHSEASATGDAMTGAYREAHRILKAHVHAHDDDVIVTTGAGTTAAVNKLQRLLGLRAPEQLGRRLYLPPEARPVVFVTHMEHHSNHTSWLETIAQVECVHPDRDGQVDLEHLRRLLQRYRARRVKIGAFTACSNVTGVRTPYRALAKLMHEHDGVCFVDFAASAPYDPIDMHPADPREALDAIYFSPHKFLGGPGACGVLVFNARLYTNSVPDHPGGGTVAWTNPWGGRRYLADIEAREDGGTPPFLQAVKAALCVRLKEAMRVERMRAREEALVQRAFAGLRDIPGLHLLAGHLEARLGILSFYVEGLHYNLVVRLLNDRFGVQVRGGCSCAGTYGHYLLHVDPARSRRITDAIDRGDLSSKPGWVRLSLHPTTTDAELDYILAAVRTVVTRGGDWAEEYRYDPRTNEFTHQRAPSGRTAEVRSWFSL